MLHTSPITLQYDRYINSKSVHACILSLIHINYSMLSCDTPSSSSSSSSFIVSYHNLSYHSRASLGRVPADHHTESCSTGSHYPGCRSSRRTWAAESSCSCCHTCATYLQCVCYFYKVPPPVLDGCCCCCCYDCSWLLSTSSSIYRGIV